MPVGQRFDAAYYNRFYGRRPVHDARRIGHLANGVMALTAWWRIPIQSVLDVGAGKGYWRDALTATHPSVHYHGLDISDYACRRFGHELADIATWRPPRRYDLVVMQSVAQYLDDPSFVRSIATIGRCCRFVLFFEAPTAADRTDVIDATGTDLDIQWRTGDWYRRLLDPSFVEIGAGLWASRAMGIPFFELERAPVSAARPTSIAGASQRRPPT